MISSDDGHPALRDYLARHALRVVADSSDERAKGIAAAGILIVEARSIAERLIAARREEGRLTALLIGLSRLTVEGAPFVIPSEALDALADRGDGKLEGTSDATEAWRAFHAALMAGDADAQLGGP